MAKFNISTIFVIFGLFVSFSLCHDDQYDSLKEQIDTTLSKGRIENKILLRKVRKIMEKRNDVMASRVKSLVGGFQIVKLQLKQLMRRNDISERGKERFMNILDQFFIDFTERLEENFRGLESARVENEIKVFDKLQNLTLQNEKMEDDVVELKRKHDYVMVGTSTEYNYKCLYGLGYDIGTATSVLFEVRACKDCHVALSTDYPMTKLYEIVIGGWENTLSVIRTSKQGSNVTTKNHAPLSCNEFRKFWISWKNGDIKVGIGLEVGKETFMEFKHSDPHDVKFVGVSTGWGDFGMFRVYK